MRRCLCLLTLTCLWIASPGAVPASAQQGFKTARGHTKPIYAESVTEEYRIPTKHGTIYGVVRRPVVPAGVKVPVILTYSPYNLTDRPTNLTGASLSDSLANYYVPRGYARAVFDLVGTRDSGGCTDFGGIRERETGAAVVDHLGSRAWANGRVAMIGGSYDGTTAYSAAIEAPQHLTTIVPQVAIDRWYDYPFHAGVRRYSGFGTPLLFDYGYGITPTHDPRDPNHLVEVAAARVNPCERALNQVRGYGPDPIYDAYWDERDYRAKVGKVRASVLIEGGWLDTNVRPVGSLRFFEALPDDHPKKLVMGQWGHAAPNLVDWTNVRHAWFDYWLYDYDGEEDQDELPDTGVMDLPRVDTEVNGRVRFQLDHWPPPGTQEVPVALVSGAPASTAQAGLVGASDTTYTATDPSVSANSMYNGCPDSEACRLFVTAPLSEQVRLSGTPHLDLVARSTPLDATQLTVSTQYVVLLFSESASGARTTIARGMLNSRNRNGERTSEDLGSGELYRGTVTFSDLDYLVPAGASLGVAIASNVQNESFQPDDDVPARNTILVADDRGPQTVLRLPVSAGAAAFPSDPAPQAARAPLPPMEILPGVR